MSDDPAATAAIDALYHAFREVFGRGDVEGILDLLTSDYTLWAPGAPPVTGEQLRPALTAAFQTYRVDSSFERVELLVRGPLAMDVGWDVQVLHPLAGGDTIVRRQRVMLILQRLTDGRWRFARGMSQPV